MGRPGAGLEGGGGGCRRRRLSGGRGVGAGASASADPGRKSGNLDGGMCEAVGKLNQAGAFKICGLEVLRSCSYGLIEMFYQRNSLFITGIFFLSLF